MTKLYVSALILQLKTANKLTLENKISQHLDEGIMRGLHVLDGQDYSGAFAFYNPETDLYFSGTVNQLSGFGHRSALRAMVKIIKAAK